ncbi:hypothetical protein BLA60_11670 [Actinophytocola xinjiangensis]|uniref:Beta-lactamase-related domain-containing protein n=1 Tax=Actinophytocola xinjiangensis TaxID=485602 RepID=A0A7Z1AZV0_9PSEU|nr:serine hydrolase domain-containing protein [Actinophytocola xinjiangensis]OLF11598.1 hypothetical protein BLA60_11670 [Actinophytocola xinjiangensis]
MSTSAEGTRTSRRVALGLLGLGPLVASGALAAADSSGGTRVSRDLLPGGGYDRFIRGLAEADQFSGTVLIAHRGRTVLARAYGLADRERGIRNEIDTIYNLASASKPFTALAIVQLAQANRLRFTDTIGTHLHDYPDQTATTVTIHHLLTHTGGLPNLVDADDKHVNNSVEEATAREHERNRRGTPRFPPGSQHEYSSVGMSILGEIVAKVTGRYFHEYVAEHILRPAGMSSSDYYTRDDWLTNPRIAHPYMYQEDGSRVDAVRNLDAGAVLGGGPGSNAARGYIGSGGGGGFATAGDLVSFATALGQDRLLTPAFRELYLSPKVPQTPLRTEATGGPDHPFGAYGVVAGLTHGEQVVGHGGGIGGGNTNWSIYRQRDLVGVILCNYDLDIPPIIAREREAVFTSTR